MMSKHRKSVTLFLLTIALLICVGFLLFEAQTRSLRRLIDDVVYDNRNHYLSCEQLPTLSQVESVVAEHQSVIHQIEQINPGLVGVEVNSITCPGKADILFWYGTHQDRVSLEGIIGGDTFFGIPYRLQNR